MDIPLENIQRIIQCSAVPRDLVSCHANLVRKVMHKNYDWWTMNEGDEGSGKSTGSIWLAKKVAPDLFIPSEHICYEPLEYLRLIDDTPRYGVILLDEAGEAIFNRDFYTEMNKAIIKSSQQCRDRNLLILFNLPSMGLLDSSLIRRFKTLVIYESKNWERGYSLWHRPVKKRYDSKAIPFWEPVFEYHFIDLPPVIRDEYQRIKTKKGKERVAEMIYKLEQQEAKNLDIDPRKVAEDIRREITSNPNERQKYLGSKGTWNRDAIRLHRRVPESIARQVCISLNDIVCQGNTTV